MRRSGISNHFNVLLAASLCKSSETGRSEPVCAVGAVEVVAQTFKQGCAKGQGCNGHLAEAAGGLDVFVLCVPTCWCL